MANGTTPAYLARAAPADFSGPARVGDWAVPAPEPARGPGAATVSVCGTCQPLTVGHCWVTSVLAVFCWAIVGSCSSPAGAGGSAAVAGLSTVPAVMRACNSIGRANP